MKVNESTLNQAAALQLGKTQQPVPVQPGGPAKSAGAQPGQPSDQVQLSDLSSRLLQSSGAQSSSRSARVEQLAADYKAGRYQPNSQATSQRMVDDAIGHAP
ncbi:MAG: flagellar biosynthesis anti-sigma factor FlgM [Bryobacteraceae bacterium]